MATTLDRLETVDFVKSMPATMSTHDKTLAFLAFRATHELPADSSMERFLIMRLLNRFVELAGGSDA